MTTRDRTTVVGVFEDTAGARGAIDALKGAGFTGEHISVLAPDREETRAVAEETGTRAGEDAAKGAVAGGVLGGLGGWLVGIGALAIPGVGPFLAAGAFATALGGAAIGAGVGAIAGALVGMGVPQEHAEYYEGEVKSGRTLVTVSADGRYDEAQRILRECGAYDVESRGAAGASASAAGGTVGVAGRAAADTESEDVTDGRTLQLREEELRTRKTDVQTGEVRLGKDIVEEQRTLEVPVTREEVTIERRPVTPRPADRPIEDAGRTLEVPVREEQVDVEKTPVVYEEVGVGKREVTQTQQVSETVRREEARIERQGDVDVRGWDDAMPRYRQRWQERHGTAGGRWEEHEPAYRYGYALRNRPEYRGRSWSQVEPDLRRDWETRNPNTPWDRARESIRETWEDR